MIKTTVNITIDRIKYSMAYAIIDVTVQTWAGPNESKVMNRESIVVLREELDSRIKDDEDREPLFLFILGEIFQRSMFRIGYGAEVVEIRDMLKIPSMRYLLYYEPGSQPVMNVKFMRLPDRWYEQQAIMLMGMILATKAEGLSLFPNEKEDRCTQGVTIKKPIRQEEWDNKLYMGWPEYLLEKMFYVSESAAQYKEDFEEWKDKKEEEI